MAVDLHTFGDSSLPYDPLLTPSHELNQSNNINISEQYLIPKDFGSHTAPLPHSDEAQRKKRVHKDDDLVAELTRQVQMAHFMLPNDHKIDFSGFGSQNLEPVVLKSWNSNSWPQSTLWSPLCSNQGSSEGSASSSPKEPSASAIQSLLHEQIRTNQLSTITQEQILSLKQKLAAHGEKNHGHIFQQFQKKDKGPYVGFGDGRRARQQRPGPQHQQARLETQALSMGSSCSTGISFCGTSSGTGVFLPRGGATAPLESSRRSGKGCSTVLIPARVVQALQLHFDQIAATSGPKPPGFPPLHDVLVSNRDGMYSLQKRQSRKKPSHVQNELILPREWTY